ncbi:hemicentin-1-like [Acropora millepora]|uniref:hemicentin-1-like n=1 Tax=Acropora millepora TaxID=45264 RepID=UPI001CF51E8E|nr:hemicentin-1-like [Acropora millepora]
MDCSVTGYPKPTVKWYKDKALYQGRNGSSKFNRGTFQTVLIIRNAVPADGGLYTCNVSNAYGWISNSYRVHVRNHERARSKPKILKMENATAVEGENATLFCKALSDSMPHFQWLRWLAPPSNALDESSQIKNPVYEVIKQNQQNGNRHLVLPIGKPAKLEFHGVKLILTNVSKKDEGKYSCIVGNAFGYAVQQAYVIVRETPAAPRFTVSETKRRRNIIVLPVGNTIKMDCSVTGYPKPTVKWYKDKALYQGRNGSSKFNRGTFQTVLIIRNAVPADGGLYTCNVSNAYGWISNSYRVHVRNHERARSKPKILKMKNATAMEGENATLFCKALSDSMPHFQWLRWLAPPSNASDESSQIKNPVYEIIKENQQNGNKHLVLPIGKPAKFDFHGVKLILTNVSKKDEGKYSCIVGNAFGYAVQQAYVIVRETPAAPRFTVSETKRRRNIIVLPVGNTIKMDCSVTGYPKPTVKWYKDKALYQGRNGSSKFNRGTFQTVLIIRNAVPADGGLYTCNVSNAYGWISNSYRVHVRNHERARSKPKILKMENATAVEGENATLFCKALSDSMPHFQWLRWLAPPSNALDESSQLKNPVYEVIKQNQQNGNRHLVLPIGKPAKLEFHGVKLILTNVSKKDEGKYSCIVGNAFGYAVQQAYVIVREIPGGKEIEDRGISVI